MPNPRLFRTKLYDNRQTLRSQIKQWQADGQTVVFTNGCFDLLHFGHVDYLEKARLHGNRLVVGINSDASITRLKGTNRPLQALESRMAVMASLEAVDAVIPFDEDTPFELIAALLPDILTKGGDYSQNAIVGRDIVEAYGGSVVVIPFVEGYSTTNIVKKMICP